MILSPVVWNGTRATISCTATGHPIPVLKWTSDFMEVNHTISTTINETTRTLNLTTEVAGYYRRQATNIVGQKRLILAGKQCMRCVYHIYILIARYFQGSNFDQPLRIYHIYGHSVVASSLQKSLTLAVHVGKQCMRCIYTV